MDLRDAPAMTSHRESLPTPKDKKHIAISDTKNNVAQASQQAKAVLKDITFGSIAGMMGKYVEYPFDTVKVRLQSQPDHLPLRYTGPLDCFRQSLRQEGFLGLYRGISAPLIGAAVETSSLFFSYRVIQAAVRATVLPSEDPLPMSALLVCGALSGSFTSLLLTPIELVKCQMQVPTERVKGRVATVPGPLAIIGSIYRHHGLSGFWHGQMGTLLRETGGGAAWFGSYETVTALFQRLRSQKATASPLSTKADTTGSASLPVYQQMLAGAAAGVSYNFIFFPADTIKSRMQTADVAPRVGEPRKTFWSIGRAIWKQQGIRGMYRGCGITCARSAPSSALIFSIYEALMARF